jgi:hypothetical protein
LQVVFGCAALVAVRTAGPGVPASLPHPAATALAATMAGVALWSAIDAAVLLVESDVLRRAYAPVCCRRQPRGDRTYATARTVSDPSWRASSRTRLLGAVVPALVVLAAVLPATRGLVMSDIRRARRGPRRA